MIKRISIELKTIKHVCKTVVSVMKSKRSLKPLAIPYTVRDYTNINGAIKRATFYRRIRNVWTGELEV
jgi:hypothetical protein